MHNIIIYVVSVCCALQCILCIAMHNMQESCKPSWIFCTTREQLVSCWHQLASLLIQSGVPIGPVMSRGSICMWLMSSAAAEMCWFKASFWYVKCPFSTCNCVHEHLRFVHLLSSACHLQLMLICCRVWNINLDPLQGWNSEIKGNQTHGSLCACK